MKGLFFGAGMLAAAAGLSGCQSIGVGGDAGGADVTRFHLGQPIARATIAVEAFDPADANSPEFGSHANAVAQQLGRLGWTVGAPRTATEQVALIDVTQGGGSRMGLGAGAAAPAEAVATRLDVRIKRRSDGTVFWEGRAVDQARGATSPEQRASAVQRLADALFRDFPGESGRTIRTR